MIFTPESLEARDFNSIEFELIDYYLALESIKLCKKEAIIRKINYIYIKT